VIGDGETQEETGKGAVRIMLRFENALRKFELQDVLLVPKLAKNLFSQTQYVEKGYNVDFNDDSVSITSKASGVVTSAGMRQGLLHYLRCTSVRQQTALTANARQLENSFQLWHQRYDHVSGESLAMLKSKDLVSGLGFQTEHMNLRFCQSCAEGKQHAN